MVSLILADIWMVGAGRPEIGSVSLVSEVVTATSTRAAAPDPGGVDSAETVPGTTVPDPAAAAAASVDPPARPGATAPAAAPAAAVPVVERGTGQFTVLPVPALATTGSATAGRVVRYTVEIEGGLGVNPVAYASTVVSVLTDPRGWQAKDGVRFVNVTPAQAADGEAPTLRIRLASPDTTDQLCAPLLTRGQVSCHNGRNVVLNARRWLLGADAYGTDVASYRIYLVNHEVGHGIGHGHAACPLAGQAAPVMMQQTYGVGQCTAWPWPRAKSS
ncbi:MAG: DUF3152 domain-containing protein [Dermatophilaceae bacterium]